MLLIKKDQKIKNQNLPCETNRVTLLGSFFILLCIPIYALIGPLLILFIKIKFN